LDRSPSRLPDEEWQRWLPQLERVEMPLSQVLYEAGATLSHVYFPTTAIVSLLYVMENGASAEIAVVGNEGTVGISLFMGGDSTPSRAEVQSAGLQFDGNSLLHLDVLCHRSTSCGVVGCNNCTTFTVGSVR
jgi:hypothetical protein